LEHLIAARLQIPSELIANLDSIGGSWAGINRGNAQS
jgi:hypothetical protein